MLIRKKLESCFSGILRDLNGYSEQLKISVVYENRQLLIFLNKQSASFQADLYTTLLPKANFYGQVIKPL